jgi:chitinase
LPDVFRDNWGFIAEEDIAPIWIGEFGGHFGFDSFGNVTPHAEFEIQWLNQLIGYIRQVGASFSYWCFNENSPDTGGLVRNDWVRPQKHKLKYLAPLLPDAPPF